MDTDPPDLARWLRRLKLQHLAVLGTIARHGTLTAAAQELECSQPAVSKWLADIESALGVALFVRGRRLRTTPYAEAMLRHADRMLGEARRMHTEIRAIRDGASGLVRLGAMTVAAAALVPAALVALRRHDATVRIQLTEDIAVGLWERFDRNMLDILVVRLDERALAARHPLEPLFEDPHCVVARPGHPLARRRQPAWRDTAAYPWLLPPADTPLRHAIDATFAEAGMAPPAPWLESASPTANRTLLRTSDCLAVSSLAASQAQQQLGILRVLPLRLSYGREPVGLVWREARPAPPVARVLAALREAARGAGSGAASPGRVRA